MSAEERKRWWRLAATSVVGGGLAVVGWFEFLHSATAEPIPAPGVSLNEHANTEPGQWYRSPNPVSQTPAQNTGEIVRISATEPQYPATTGPVVPAIPSNTQTQIAPTAGPRSFDSGLVGNPSQLPSIPAIPDSGSVQPTAPIALPAIPSMNSQSIALPSGVENTPNLPAIPVPTPTMGIPAPPDSTSGIPGVPPSANLTSLTPPSKFPDTIQPIIPVQPDSSLPSRNEGITVKTENPPNGGWVQSFPNSPAALPVPGIGQTNIPTPGSIPVVPAIPVVGTNEGTYGKVADRPKATETTLPHSEKYSFPLPDPNRTKTVTSGDNTMFSFNQHTAALAVMGGLFLGPTAPMTALAKDDKGDIAELRNKVDDANKKLTDIQKDLQKLTELLNGRKDSQGFPVPSDPGVVAQLKILKDNLAIIEQDINKLKAQASTSLKPTTVTPVPEIKTGRGTVRIVNEYPIQISMVVNGTSYQIPPSKEVVVEVAAGDFTYQLLQSGASPTLSKIRDKESVTLRIK
ncbi:MAG TPA: hypothetical protein VG097_15005 [Gemmata sp.]|jgi:hypothetical protein|nr:hypothetical protein [Gemmata sp.]